MYLHSVNTYNVVFIISGGVRHSHHGFIYTYLQHGFVWLHSKQIHQFAVLFYF